MPTSQKYNDLKDLDKLCINTIRFLSVEAIQKANSGHPGLPMGMAPAVFSLFTNHLKFNSANPEWANRDRFVLSAGHGSALLYSILHLSGYKVSLDDIKNFRQWGSKTPGHPEYGHTEGVEATTGPLGQGISNAVGMAIAEKFLSDYFNKPSFPIIDHKIYVLAGDGCLQEGIASEACSLAGHLGLGSLIVIYDDNRITIDGRTDISFTEDVAKRFEAYGWHVQDIPGDGHDLEAFNKAIDKAKAETGRPSLVKFQSIIGYGSPNKQDTSGVHGSPLGEEELALAKKELGWDFTESFYVPGEVREVFNGIMEKGKQAQKDWKTLTEKYRNEYPELGSQLESALSGKISEEWEKHLPSFEAGKSIATRKASGMVLEGVMPHLPLVMGGSADLTPSNNTRFSQAEVFQKDNPGGRYLHFGVREHAMGAILNGLALNGMVRAYGATFLCFADYMLPAIRVASLSGYPSLFVFTHDSIGLGEDGPTHQPVEQVSYLRALPGLISIRPADAYETAEAWRFALNYKQGPVAISLTRQGLPVLDQDKFGSAGDLSKGGYVLIKDDQPELILIATGSEVSLALEAYEKLSGEGVKVQVVSMPCVELFEKQSADYQNTVVPPDLKARVVIEAGLKRGWEGYLGEKGEFVGMSGFGASAPGGVLFREFGITLEAVLEAARKVI